MAFQRKKKNPSQVPENQRTTFLKSELKIDGASENIEDKWNQGKRMWRCNLIKGVMGLCETAIPRGTAMQVSSKAPNISLGLI